MDDGSGCEAANEAWRVERHELELVVLVASCTVRVVWPAVGESGVNAHGFGSSDEISRALHQLRALLPILFGLTT